MQRDRRGSIYDSRRKGGCGWAFALVLYIDEERKIRNRMNRVRIWAGLGGRELQCASCRRMDRRVA